MKIRSLVEHIETYVTDLMQGRRHSRMDSAARCTLFALSSLYRNLVQFRITLYQQRLFRPRTLGCLVVSIGNLSCGGTGKTPVVEVFSRILTEKGRKVAILSRGYRSKSTPFLESLVNFFFKRHQEIPPRVVSDGENMLLSPEMSGDEPYMLANNLKGVVVLVDKDRVKSGRYAIMHYDADTLILDDGFQYLPLKPRLNILLIDSTRPFDNHYLLPRGLLREPIRNIRRADYIFLTKSNGGSHLRHLKSFVKKHNPWAEIIECTHRPQHLQDVGSGEKFDLDFLRGKKLAAISAIAAPESFEEFLRGFGSELVYLERFADHHWYTRAEINDFVEKAVAHGAELVITTEKDSVRLPNMENCAVPILFMRVEIDVLSGHESFADCISRLCYEQISLTETFGVKESHGLYDDDDDDDDDDGEEEGEREEEEEGEEGETTNGH